MRVLGRGCAYDAGAWEGDFEVARTFLSSSVKTEYSGIFCNLYGFYFASSAAWNALPVHLRDPELSLNSFKTKLRAHFLSRPHLGYIYHLNLVRLARQHDNLWRVQMSVLN